jgi:hypothetical protein
MTIQLPYGKASLPVTVPAKNLIGVIDRDADYTPIQVTVPDLGQTYTIYDRTPETVNTHDYLITNYSTASSPWVLLNPVRKYEGIEFLFNKRFSNRWQLLASYVLSRATGTVNNDFASDLGRFTIASDPNTWIFAQGHLTNDPTHMIKLQGSYLIPWIDVSFNAYFRAITGDAWTTRFITLGIPVQLNQGLVTFFTQPRGTNHYPIQTILDVRLEKIFTLAKKYRLGLILDVFNVFNSSTITSWGTRIGYDWTPGDYPSTDGHDLYSIVNPRQARVGIRMIF